MSYKFTTGSVDRGDIYNEDDTHRNTYLDWSEDALGVVAGGTTNFVVSSSTVGIGTASPSSSFALDIPVSVSTVRMGRLELGAWPNATSYGFIGHSYQDHHGSGRHAKYNIQIGSGGDLSLNAVAGQDMYFRIGAAIKAGIDSNGFFGIGPNAGHPSHWAPSAQLHVSSSDDEMVFLCHDAQQNPLLAVTGSGKVGIGTASPTHEFEVYPDEDITAIIGRAFIGHSFNNDAATFGHYDRQGSHYAIYQNSSGLTILNTGASQAMYFRINNSNKAILDSNGQFGIGTTSAQSLLHVSGSGGILFQVDETSGSIGDAILFVTSSGEACRFGVGTSTPSSTLQVSGSRAANLTSFSTDTNLDETHCIVTFTGDTGVTGNLPAVDKCTGRIYHFFNQLDQGSNPLVIDGGSANVGTDGTTLAINPDEGNSSVSIVSNGSQWMIFGLYQQSEGGE